MITEEQIITAAKRFAARVSGVPNGWRALDNGGREKVIEVIKECASDYVGEDEFIVNKGDIQEVLSLLKNESVTEKWSKLIGK